MQKGASTTGGRRFAVAHSGAGSAPPDRRRLFLLGIAGMVVALTAVPLSQHIPRARAPASSPPTGAVAGRPLPVYELRIDSSALRELERNPFADQTHPATFRADGRQLAVQVRHRGAWARTWPKRPLKIFFAKGQEFQGKHCLNLNSAWRDPSFVREPLAYRVYAACGVPAPAAQLVRLDLNGQFFGVFVEVEQPDKPLLKRHGLKGASLYKANSRENRSDLRDLGSDSAYAAHYEKETHKADTDQDLREFCQELAAATNAVDFFNHRVEVGEYVDYLCASALVQNWDWLNKNHFLAHDRRGSQRWVVLPWDLDRTFGDHWRGSFTEARVPLLLGTRSLPGPTGWNRLADRFLGEPSLRARFLTRLEELLNKEFTSEKLYPLLDQWAADLSDVAALDRRRWPADSSDLQAGIDGVKRFIEHRRAFLRVEIARLRGTTRNAVTGRN